MLESVEILEGRYESYPSICRECKTVQRCIRCDKPQWVNKEKRTDVAIAVNMLDDAYNNLYDVAYLISADTDFVPALEKIRLLQKTIIVCFPPNKRADELLRFCNSHKKIIDYIDDCELPEELKNRFGYLLKRPAEWH